jgi:hypothetical protein
VRRGSVTNGRDNKRPRLSPGLEMNTEGIS